MNKLTVISALLLGTNLLSCGILSKDTKATPVPVRAETAVTESNPAKKKEQTVNARKKLAGEWIVTSALGRETNPRDGDLPYISFNQADNKIYGNLGCNFINGDYTISDKDGISFSNVTTTLRQCDFIREETDIVESLNRAAGFYIHKKNGQYFLDMSDGQNNAVLHARRHNAYALSGSWLVEKIKERNVSDLSIELVIDIPELRLHGNTGCNIINGTIGLDRNKDWFVQFQDINSTRKACDGKMMAVERDLLVSLEEVEIIKKENDKTTRLLDKNGDMVLTLTRIELKEK